MIQYSFRSSPSFGLGTLVATQQVFERGIMANNHPYLQFHGAVGGVTGSRTTLTAGSKRILVDCGMFQGTKQERLQNWTPFPFDQTQLSAVFLTHAHLDHSGALPLLVKNGYSGPIYCTAATARLIDIMLRDSGHLQEEEAEFRNRRGWTKHSPALPLYTVADAERCIDSIRTVEFNELIEHEGFKVRFTPASHILGSAHVHVTTPDGRTVLFSGDIGRGDHILLGDVPPRPPADTVICESTYGDRRHPAVDPIKELRSALHPVLKRGGTALIPAFAVGRAQEIIVAIESLFEQGGLQRCPVYLDSPMSSKALKVTLDERDELTDEARRLLTAAVHHLEITGAPAESKALNEVNGPAIIISASGMIEGGRILHHILARADRKNDALILSGYQAFGTRGRRIADGEEEIRIFGQPTKLHFEICGITSFSAHADQQGLLEWLQSGPQPAKVFLNHGESSAMASLAQAVRTIYDPEFEVYVAHPNVRYDLPDKPVETA